MKGRILSLAVWMAAAVGCAIFIEGFVRQVLLQPLLYTAWVAELFIRSLPQGVFWGLLTLVVLYLAVKSLSFRRPRTVNQRTRPLEQLGPVAQWQNRLQRSRRLDYANWTLMRELRRLTLEIATGEKVESDPEAVDTVSLREVDLPERFLPYFETRMEGSDSSWNAFLHRLPFGPQAHPFTAESHPEPHEIVSYLEERTMVRNKQE